MSLQHVESLHALVCWNPVVLTFAPCKGIERGNLAGNFQYLSIDFVFVCVCARAHVRVRVTKYSWIVFGYWRDLNMCVHISTWTVLPLYNCVAVQFLAGNWVHPVSPLFKPRGHRRELRSNTQMPYEAWRRCPWNSVAALDEGISGDYVRSDQLYGDRPVFIKAHRGHGGVVTLLFVTVSYLLVTVSYCSLLFVTVRYC